MKALLDKLQLKDVNPGACTGPDGWIEDPQGKKLVSYNPTTGQPLGSVIQATGPTYDKVVQAAQKSFETWRVTPAPQRGLLIRDLADALREYKEPLGEIVTLEMGKIKVEGMGEVQEMIDICDFAVGLYRQLYGLSMHSERPGHRMYEQWHPLGPIGIITAFNFPVAVWSWNAAIAAVCGDTMLWKPSPTTPLTTLAVQQILVATHQIAIIGSLRLPGEGDRTIQVGERRRHLAFLLAGPPCCRARRSCASPRRW